MELYDVVGIGNAIVDILQEVEDSFIEKHQFVKSAMKLIDEEKAKDLYNAFTNSVKSSGGSVANTVVGISSFGGSTAFIGKVKDDKQGRIFVEDIINSGVAYKTEMSTKGASTATSFIAITKDAERSMSTYLGATKDISSSDISEEIISNSKIIYLEGYLWDDSNASEAIVKAVDFAKKYNREIAFSMSDLFCVERYRDEFISFISKNVDILFANEEEITSICHSLDLKEAISFFSKKCSHVIVTKGSKGSVVATDNDIHSFDAPLNVNVQDTTGAGDLYAAGFLYGYTQGKSLSKCIEFANIAAREVIQHIGARPKTKLCNFLKKA